MRIGVYSDVHANLTALKAVLAAYEDLGDIDHFVCLGDVVGYGAFPQECCDIVRQHVRHTVLGNHDAAVCGRMDYSYYYPAAKQALNHHAELLAQVNRDWLTELPYTVNFEYLCFSHGNPVKPENFDYVFTPEQAKELLAHWDQLNEVTLIGHSHLTKSFKLTSDNGESSVEELKPDTVTFEPRSKYVVTVGSVGQPRDNDARACFTVVDLEARTLRFHRAEYDIYTSAEAIWNDENLAPDFGKRLFLGV